MKFCSRLVTMLLTMPVSCLSSSPESDEPPKNPFLADSSWPMTHRNTYNQGSTLLPGPEQKDRLIIDFTYLLPTVIGLVSTKPDANGNRNLWFHTPFKTGKLMAKTNQATEIVDIGVYNLLDSDGAFFAFHDRTLMKFSNIGGSEDVESDIVREDQFQVPSELFRSESDYPLGLNILYDGNLVFTTSQGVLIVIGRNFTILDTLTLGDQPEEISNNLAVDENNGIYAVSSAKMRKIQWNGSTVAIAWESDYQTGFTGAAGRLGGGSGTTPSLMGTKPDDDKLVVITDAARVMNVVLFWRDEIPVDWPGLPGKNRRIAAEVPITFGNPQAESSVTEQSALVRGYGAMFVNNDYGLSLPNWFPAILNQLFVLLTGFPLFTPQGMEKFEWNPSTRTLESVWANQISCPNGIPTMSATSGLAYCLGRRFFTWKIEAVSWVDGTSAFYQPLGFQPRYNSAYSAMQVVENKEILSGSFIGALRVMLAE